MPRGVLPEAARVLPPAGQKIWLSAFNSALDEGQPEEEASKEAWAAVKRAGYERKSSGKWGKSMDLEMTLNEDDSFTISAPLTKIDVEKRVVGGFATLDNVDNAGDVLDADASQEAFKKWFGNIREMHDKKAVGKAISWEPRVHTDEDGTQYNGIWVEAKISKGAEDTWQKVLDGTLGGFSVGGATLEKQRSLFKTEDGERQVWRITKYRLTELSLVDAPCNGLARISLIKSLDGDTEVDDIVADEDTMEKAHDGYSGDHVDLSSQLMGVISALEAWRDAAVENNVDYHVICASEMLASVRYKCKMECDEAEIYSDKEDNEEEEYEMSKADSDSFKPTSGMVSEANRGLAWRDEFNRGGTAVGIARARDISGGKNLPMDTVKRMYSFFSRHEVDKQGEGFNQGEPGYPSNGRIAWALWGGDAGYSWSKSIVARDSDTEKSIDEFEDDIEKVEDALTDKEISDNNIVEEFTEEQKGVFRKLLDLFKTEVRTEISGDELTIEGEGETPEMNTEEVTKAIDEATASLTEELTKSVDDKFAQVGDSLTKIAEALEKVATAEVVESIKGEVKAEIDALVERIVALEESGAVKKSGDEAGKTAKEEKMEKGEGFWSGSLLPDFLVK
jgi:cation transport regulator ChaB